MFTLISTPQAVGQETRRDAASEVGFLASINAERAAGGLGALILNDSMSTAAEQWTIEMAEGSFLAHATDIVTGTPDGWDKVGENVGRGQSVLTLTNAFMTSAGHRANIMDPTFTEVGIAVYTHPSDGRIYTTHRFAAIEQQDAPTTGADGAGDNEPGFGPAPEQLAFVNNESELRKAKLASKTAKPAALQARDR